MKSAMQWCWIVVVASNMAISASSSTWNRYQIIVDRDPFGPGKNVPLDTAVADSFAKNLRMCAVLDLPAGLRVGLFDTKTKKDVYLKVGETSEDGIQLVSANYRQEEAVLKKDHEIVRLKIQSDMTPASGPQIARLATMPTAPAAQVSPSQAVDPSQPSPQVLRESLRQHLAQFHQQMARSGQSMPLPSLPPEPSGADSSSPASSSASSPAYASANATVSPQASPTSAGANAASPSYANAGAPPDTAQINWTPPTDNLPTISAPAMQEDLMTHLQGSREVIGHDGQPMTLPLPPGLAAPVG